MASRRRSQLSMETIGGTQFDIIQPQAPQSGSDALNRLKGWEYKPKNAEREWQAAAFSFAAGIGEIGRAIEHTANTVMQCKLVVLVEDDDGELIPAEKGSPGDLALKALVSEHSDTYDDILFQAARSLQIAGECYFVGRAVEEDENANGIWWDIFSIQEMSPKGETWEILTADGHEALDEDDIVDRLFRPDPEYKWRATSAMRGILDLCSQLKLLEQNVKAVAESRLSAQVWYMPDDITLHTVEEAQNSATGPGGKKMNPVVRKFLEHASAPIQNPDSAARLVPLVMTGPADGKDRMGVIDVTRAPDAVQATLREEVIIRIARGLDIPVEVIFGMGDTNHWTSYGISAQYLGDHIEPLGNRIAAFLTKKYLRPMLQQFEGIDAAEAQKYVMIFDTAPVTSRVDDGPATRAAFDRGEASAERYRASIGLTEADAPSREEMALRDLRALMMGAKATYGAIALKWLYMAEEINGFEAVAGFTEEWLEWKASQGGGGGGIGSTDDEDPNEADPERDPQDADPDGDGDDESEDGGTPEDNQDEPERNENTEAAVLRERIMTAANRDLRRTLTRAGSRAYSKSRSPRFEEIRESIGDAEGHEVVAALSDGELRQLGLSRAGLVEGEFADLWSDVREWIFFDLDGRDEGQQNTFINEGKATKIADEFVEKIEALAVAGLSAPLPKDRKGYLVPEDLLVI